MFRSHPSENHHLQKVVSERYVYPFIQCLKQTELDETEIIRSAFKFLQMRFSELKMNHFGRLSNALQFITDFDNTNMNKLFREQLIKHPNLKQLFINLGALYLDSQLQKTVFPNVMAVEIQTCIRELFHDYLNPLSQMKIDKLDTRVITDYASGIQQNGLFFQTPVDIQKLLYSFMDYKTRYTFKNTCKMAYFLHKSIEDAKPYILYMVSGKVKITRPTKWLEQSVEYAFRDKVPDHEILDALQQSWKAYEVTVFHSLYQALEYCSFAFRFYKKSTESDEIGYIPSLWAVAYLGDPRELKFKRVNYLQNEYTSTSNYEGNHRETLTSYAMTGPDNIKPLFGVVTNPNSDFATYRVFNSLDYSKRDDARASRCIFM